MRVLLSTYGTRGDVEPFVALAKALKARGHDVALCTPTGFRDTVERHGVPYAHMDNAVLELTEAILRAPTRAEQRRLFKGFGAIVRAEPALGLAVSADERRGPPRRRRLHDGRPARGQANRHLPFFRGSTVLGTGGSARGRWPASCATEDAHGGAAGGRHSRGVGPGGDGSGGRDGRTDPCRGRHGASGPFHRAGASNVVRSAVVEASHTAS
jgi:hypothetical protein